MDAIIRRIEELSNNSFPAIQTELFDGWLLRFSDGYTYRANCIYPLYLSEKKIQDKIKICEEKYFQKNLPTIFKITSHTPPELDIALEKSRYTLVKTVNLMTCKMNDTKFQISKDIKLSYTMDDEWLNSSLQLSGISDNKLQEIQYNIFKKISLQTVYIKAKRNDKVVGCGLGVIDDGFVGLYDIHVDENFRCQGIGSEICQAILQTSLNKDVTHAYLQVHSLNEKAIRLYKKLGFSSLYTYWFREKTAPNCRSIID